MKFASTWEIFSFFMSPWQFYFFKTIRITYQAFFLRKIRIRLVLKPWTAGYKAN